MTKAPRIHTHFQQALLQNLPATTETKWVYETLHCISQQEAERNTWLLFIDYNKRHE